MIYENGKTKIVVLHILNKMDRAGAETLIMNIMRDINKDVFLFEFLVKTKEQGQYDEEIAKLGGKIFHIKRFNGLNYCQYKRDLAKFYSMHPEIDIVHAHQGSSAAIDTFLAKKSGKKTIAHSHNTFLESHFSLKEFFFKLASFPTRFICDFYIGCSEAALVSRYGKKIRDKKRCIVLSNGIDIDKFSFSKSKRDHFRKEHSINENCKLCVFIGRLTKIKNPFFAIKVIKSVLRENKNAVLYFAGEGPLKRKLIKKIKREGLEDSVYLLGNISNVDSLIMASDILIMPSLKEGFPVTLVEAQCSNTPCLVSDQISKEVLLSSQISFLSIRKKSDVDIWAKEILQMKDCERNTLDVPPVIEEKFSQKKLVDDISKIYLDLSGQKNE